jgi:hypothetical protein
LRTDGQSGKDRQDQDQGKFIHDRKFLAGG